ncbi:DUF3108 domain-containing protein [Vulgatibacter sp.]|uniref:DUF3108 domain-containing protein n=1 Tax=Vulgatibacter sp. TaxID=1971226 RepID=UPI0035696D7B
MKNRWTTILAAVLLVPQFALADEIPAAASAVEEQPVAAEAMPFADGERLLYEVSLLGITAGEAELRVEGLADEWRLHASGKTVGATDSIFGLRQSASCTVSDELSPEVCLFTSRQRKGMRRREMRFDKKTGEVRERTLQDGKRSEKTRKFGEGGVQDALSGLYLLRKDLPAQGETMSFRSLRKGKAITVQATAIGEETVETEAGRFLATVIDLRIMDKVDKDAATRAKVWFSADDRRLPVKISLDAPVGSLEAELTAASGTRGGSLAGR